MWKKILGGIVIFIVLVVGLAVWATSGLTDTATAFFDKIKAHDYKTAYYGYFSEDFKGKVSLEKFKQYIETNRMDQFKEINWGNREVDNGKGTLEGTLIMPGGSTIPIVVGFVKGQDNWKIYSIKKSEAGLITEKANISSQKSKSEESAIPPKEERIRLARQTVALLAEAVKAKDTSEFYNSISDLWKKQTTPEKFYQIFASLMKGANLVPLESMMPIENKEPTIDKYGILRMEIYYNTDSVKPLFKLSYIKENGDWKLSGIYIETKK